MKKTILILSVLLSVLVLSSCAGKSSELVILPDTIPTKPRTSEPETPPVSLDVPTTSEILTFETYTTPSLPDILTTPAPIVTTATPLPSVITTRKPVTLAAPETTVQYPLPITPEKVPSDLSSHRRETADASSSTCFSEVYYYPDLKLLFVRFRDSGSLYTYSDFPSGEWSTFRSQNSLGGYYNSNIKGQYVCTRIE